MLLPAAGRRLLWVVVRRLLPAARGRLRLLRVLRVLLLLLRPAAGRLLLGLPLLGRRLERRWMRSVMSLG